MLLPVSVRRRYTVCYFQSHCEEDIAVYFYECVYQKRIGQINVTSEKTREIAGRQKGCLVSYTYSEESSPTCALSSIAFYLLNDVL